MTAQGNVKVEDLESPVKVRQTDGPSIRVVPQLLDLHH